MINYLDKDILFLDIWIWYRDKCI